MMFNTPFFNLPFYRYTPPHYYNIHKPVDIPNNMPEVQSDEHLNTSNNTTKKSNFSTCNPQVFNILGITLLFDDILIICLLFFLYSEGVQDDMLFIALVLLLLS